MFAYSAGRVLNAPNYPLFIFVIHYVRKTTNKRSKRVPVFLAISLSIKGIYCLGSGGWFNGSPETPGRYGEVTLEERTKIWGSQPLERVKLFRGLDPMRMI